eukprot:jgi/Astpho2/4606/Aster-00181
MKRSVRQQDLGDVLLLVEEVDVILDADRGFHSAVVNLMKTTKLLDRVLSVQRPIIMTANATVPAMAANKQVMTVDMLAPPAPEVLRLLVLAAAQEGRRCTLQELQHCSNTAEGDVQRSMTRQELGWQADDAEGAGEHAWHDLLESPLLAGAPGSLYQAADQSCWALLAPLQDADAHPSARQWMALYASDLASFASDTNIDLMNCLMSLAKTGSKSLEQSGSRRKQHYLVAVEENVKDIKIPEDVKHEGVANLHAHTTAAQDSLAHAKIIFVLGGPGSGKGTQCERIAAKYSCKHLSAGDLLREEVKSGSEKGKELAAIMKEGKLVPQAVTIELLRKAMIKSSANNFLIDGFPRALDQAESFEKEVKPCQLVRPRPWLLHLQESSAPPPHACASLACQCSTHDQRVLFFDCPEETMKQRLTSRGKTSGRADDNEETIIKRWGRVIEQVMAEAGACCRFKTFQEESLPVVERYEAEGKAKRISAVPAPEVVFEEVVKVVDPLFGAPSTQGASQPSSDLASKVDHVPGDLPAHSKIVFVLGGPGSGKGTQCERIVAKYGYKHLSSGDLLRDEVKSGSELGKALEDTMKEGKLVPTELQGVGPSCAASSIASITSTPVASRACVLQVTIALLRKAMVKSGARKFLVDGFPRALDQAEIFERDIKPCQLVIFFDCPEATMEERLLGRGKTSGRADDNADTIKKRFHTFVNSSMPVVTHYEREGKLHKISAVPPAEEVFEHVQRVLDKLE